MSQNRERGFFSPENKVAALQKNVFEKIPLSQICEELGIVPNASILGNQRNKLVR